MTEGNPGPGRRRLGAVLVAIVLVAGLVLWQLFDRGESATDAVGTQADQRLPGSSVPVIGHISALQAKSFSLLRTLPEGLPPTVTSALRQPAYGLNWQLAQRIPTPARGRFWAVPGRDVLCVVAQEQLGVASTYCAKTPDAIAHGLVAVLLNEASGPGSLGSTSRRIVGIAPDGTRGIHVHTNGLVTSAPVVGGVFTLQDRLDDPPQRLVPFS